MKAIKTLLILIGAFCLMFVQVEAKGYKNVKLTERGKDFLQMMIPQVKYVNWGIHLQRKTVEFNKYYFEKTGILTNDDIQTINGIAARYDMEPLNVNVSEQHEDVIAYMDALLERVDYIPEKMIIAQAIIESGWGKSRSARECNNYFGLTCKGCGGYVVTGNETNTYYLKKYDSLADCIADYARILNTKSSYSYFRKLRAELRKDGKPMNSQYLTRGLMKYSELGSFYIYKVNFVIHKYLSNDLFYYMQIA